MQTNSPRSLSIYISLFVSLFALSLIVITFWYKETVINLWLLLLIFILIFSVTFTLVYFTLERFIYHKIKLLYRATNMYRIKKDFSSLDLDMKTDIMGKVSKDVARWMVDQHNAIGRLEERESFRREFIGNLAHELKTPVFSIQGYILTLLEGGLEDKEINRLFLERAANGVERITSLIKDLDAISKLESGQVNLEKKRFDFIKLAQEVADELEMKAKKRKIKLEIQNSFDKEIWVNADRVKIAQVLTNLLNNAITYSKEGGNVIVKSNQFDRKILIDVEDDGVGINQEDLDRIFERFYRVEKSRARHKGGTGLGLAIVKHIIEAHGESITAQSKPGKGTTFTFSLSIA
jgi:two-component system phosphate regulon sensor histidine kinase PhoR